MNRGFGSVVTGPQAAGPQAAGPEAAGPEAAGPLVIEHEGRVLATSAKNPAACGAG